MKRRLLKLALITGLITSTSMLAKAQKFGDNLGNHTATKDLQMSAKFIYNAAGIAIGNVAITNTSIALQVDGTKQAILIPRISALADVAAPLNGMIVYNTPDDKFYVYQGGAWVTFALGLKMDGDGINTVSNANGYTLTTVGQQTVLKLSPADVLNPGIVTITNQSFAGDKSFAGNVAVLTGKTLTVTDAATILGGTVSAAGNVTVGTATLAANTALNGNLGVTGTTVLNGSTVTGGVTTSAVQLLNAAQATATETQTFIVVDSLGNLKKGTFNNKSLSKYKVNIVSGTSAKFNVEGNSGVDVLIPIADILADDAIVVNFPSDERTAYAGLTILSASATAAGIVTVTIADFRNPAEVGYTLPAIDSSHLIVTKYSAVNR